MVYDSDRQFDKLMNAVFTPLDMTDYEEDFVGWQEFPGALPINRQSWLTPIQEEAWPQVDATAAIETMEEQPTYGTTQTQKGMIIDNNTIPEPEDEDFYGKEEEDEYGDDYGEEGEGGEGGEEDYGDYGEEEEEWSLRKDVDEGPEQGDRFFRAGETLRGKYSDHEVEQFMKLLNVKPYKQWQDQSKWHYKLGVHDYEDQNQEVDPDFHLLSEEERKFADKEKTRQWRRGSEIKFVVDGRVPITPHYRF